ncbi:putative peptidase M13, armadillo-like helical [Helianthus annuus]|nr:putative armadillo-like helical protein [Helianthus annuus]KAJ0744497.1 putative armadillo-like helical protein [Helianthus annuus]KAJ0880574.1 putative peptidase M13, armadillo-like helical [Helianthus annuus]
MKGLFKSKPRTPADLVRHLRHLLPYAAPNSAIRTTKRLEKVCELRKVILEMRTVLYGDERLEPAEEACVKLTQEFFKEDTCYMLIASLPHLDPGTRQDVTHVIANLQRQRVNGRYLASEYLESNTAVLAMLLPGCENSELAISYGAILRDCIRHQVAAKYILESDHIKLFFRYIQDSSFDIASDAAATFTELLTRHKSTVAEYLSENYDWFFREYSSLLESSNYITRRNAVRLLRAMLLDRSNTSVMVRYVCSLDNLRIVMNLLRDSNKTIQLEAFHVFKLFAANQRKPQEIVKVLVANRSKLIRFFSDFSFEKADEQFESDKAEVVREIATLELTGPPCSSFKEISC